MFGKWRRNSYNVWVQQIRLALKPVYWSIVVVSSRCNHVAAMAFQQMIRCEPACTIFEFDDIAAKVHVTFHQVLLIVRIVIIEVV